MKIEHQKSASSLEFTLTADSLDGITSVDRVWFRFDRPVTLDVSRLALIAYLLSEDLVGNVFECLPDGVPANLASAIQRSIAGHELFVSPVTNEARRLTFEPKFRSFIFAGHPGSAVPQEVDLVVSRTTLGYDISSRDQLALRIATNLPLFLAVSSQRPLLAQELIVFLVAFDTLKPATLALSSEADGDIDRAQVLFSEVGGLIQHGKR